MPQFAFDPSQLAVERLRTLPGEWTVVFDPGNPGYEIQLVKSVPRGYGGHILALIDHLQLVDQDPPVSREDGAELLRQFLLRSSQT